MRNDFTTVSDNDQKDRDLLNAIGHLESTWDYDNDGVMVASVIDPKTGITMTATSNWDGGGFVSAEKQIIECVKAQRGNVEFSNEAYAVTLLPPSLTENKEGVTPSINFLKDAGIKIVHTWAPENQRAGLEKAYDKAGIEITFSNDQAIAAVAEKIMNAFVNDDLHTTKENLQNRKKAAGEVFAPIAI